MPGIWLKSVEDLRKIEWSKSWLWDIRFQDPTVPANFKDWFPATTVEEKVYNLEDKNVESPLIVGAIPWKDSSVNVISMNFIDDIRLSIEEWLDYWVNVEIRGNGKYTSCISDCVKRVDIAKLANNNEIIKTNSYVVFPKGALFFSGTSDAGQHSSGLEFVVAGKITGED